MSILQISHPCFRHKGLGLMLILVLRKKEVKKTVSVQGLFSNLPGTSNHIT